MLAVPLEGIHSLSVCRACRYCIENLLTHKYMIYMENVPSLFVLE